MVYVFFGGDEGCLTPTEKEQKVKKEEKAEKAKKKAREEGREKEAQKGEMSHNA